MVAAVVAVRAAAAMVAAKKRAAVAMVAVERAVARAVAMERVVVERVEAKAVGGDEGGGGEGGGGESYTVTCPSACKLIPSCVSECPRPLITTAPLMVSCSRWCAGGLIDRAAGGCAAAGRDLS